MAQIELSQPGSIEGGSPGFWVNQKPPMEPRNAPISQVGIMGWLRANLFSSFWNGLLTVVTIVLVYLALSTILRWVLTDAYWEPIWVNRKLLAVYTYPWDRIWQPGTALAILSFLLGMSAGKWGGFMRALAIGVGTVVMVFGILPGIDPTARTIFLLAGGLVVLGYFVGRIVSIPVSVMVFLWIAALPVCLWIIRGAVTLPILGNVWTSPLGQVSYTLIGGLMLTLILAAVGITLSFPLGVLLALGRRSNLPVIKYVCVAYIELIRGVPLITLLFMAMLALPLALPAGTTPPENAVRAMVAITGFSAAYMAEVVRGGLQAMPKGQYEAADALGLSLWTKYTRIIMPQALRAVVPAIVSNFISMMKDTSLVALVGLIDFLGAADSIRTQSQWVTVQGGIAREVYLFAAVVYFCLSFGLSSASRRLETKRSGNS